MPFRPSSHRFLFFGFIPGAAMTIDTHDTHVNQFSGGRRMNNEYLMTIPELMKFLQVKRNTIYTLRKQGLPTMKIGRSVRFRIASVLTWLTEMEQTNQGGVEALVKSDSSHLL